MRKALREVAEADMPILAECGGFLYLQQTLEDSQGKAWPMTGIWREPDTEPGGCSALDM